VAGTEHDETRWLELKSSLDVSSKAGQVARAILGLSNRDPDVAAQWCEARTTSSSEQTKVATVDHVVLENGLAPYLGTGDDATRWSPDYVQVDVLDVLVVTVEAPRYGDRIKPLRKEFDLARAGNIFVRGQAKTEAATRGEIMMLKNRLLRVAQDKAMSWPLPGQYAPSACCAWQITTTVRP